MSVSRHDLLESLGDNDHVWDWTDLPQQEAFLAGNIKYTCFSGSFNSGKTSVLCARVWSLLTEIPGNKGYFGRQDGKSFRQTTLVDFEQFADRSMCQVWNDQKGVIQLKEEYGGSILIYGDFKDEKDLKNHNLGFFAVDQMEEISSHTWDMLCGRLRRKLPYLDEEYGLRQYFVAGECPARDGSRHHAIGTTRECVACGAGLPAYSNKPDPVTRYKPWELVEYPKYGFGVANPEGPSHWIFETFAGLPSANGVVSTGKPHTFAVHASVYDAFAAGFVDREYLEDLEETYADVPLMKQRYLEGLWVEAEGLVYPMYAQAVHRFRPEDVRWDFTPLLNTEWPLFEMIDPGLTSPTGILWMAIEPQCACGCGRPNFWIVGESYHIGPVNQQAVIIKSKRLELKWGAAPVLSYIDKQACSKTQSRTDLLFSLQDEYTNHDILTVENQKGKKLGIDLITQLLNPDPKHMHPVTGELGGPHLMVSTACKYFDWEIKKYPWKKAKPGAPNKEEPRDGDDHLLDGLNGGISSHPELTISTHVNKEPQETPRSDSDFLWSFSTEDMGGESWMSA